ncbi:hypothetical protein B0H14DRAFT_2183745, partial [Mycena olivaceomarginata]
VEIAPGAALDVAGNCKGKQSLKTKLITLSGIGDKAQLSQHGIKPIVHLPGVGTNLQDHDEVSHIWELEQNHTIFNNCTVLYTTETDPCLEQWIED